MRRNVNPSPPLILAHNYIENPSHDSESHIDKSGDVETHEEMVDNDIDGQVNNLSDFPTKAHIHHFAEKIGNMRGEK